MRIFVLLAMVFSSFVLILAASYFDLGSRAAEPAKRKTEIASFGYLLSYGEFGGKLRLRPDGTVTFSSLGVGKSIPFKERNPEWMLKNVDDQSEVVRLWLPNRGVFLQADPKNGATFRTTPHEREATVFDVFTNGGLFRLKLHDETNGILFFGSEATLAREPGNFRIELDGK